MAPKHSNEHQLKLDNERLETPEEDYRPVKQKSDDEKDWTQRMVDQLRNWLVTKRGDSFFSAQPQWVAAAILALAVAAMHRVRASEGFSSVAKRKSLFSMQAVMKLLQGPEYYSKSVKDVSLSMLQTSARGGLVSRALVGAGEIVFQNPDGKWQRSKLPPNSPAILSDMMDLLSNNGCSDVSALPETLTSRIATPVLAALPFVYLALMYRIFKNFHGDNDMKLLTNTPSDRKKGTGFDSVAGLDTIMPEVEEIVDFLQNPVSYHAVGARPPRGVLLHGPPGSGKTLMAQAVAGEANAAFIACSGSEFCEMYVGRGAARVRSLFQRARSMALHQQGGSSWWSWPWGRKQRRHPKAPATAIIFIDEFDALAKSRSYGGGLEGGNDERDQTLNQLLTEMDGFSTPDSDITIIVIAATNRPDVLDPAILRRFDRQIHVPYPNAQGRCDIFKIHARSTNCDWRHIDWNYLASTELTANFSGSDVRNVVNDAALLAVRDQSHTVQQAHLEHAVRRAKAMKANSDLGSLGGQQFLFYPTHK